MLSDVPDSVVYKWNENLPDGPAAGTKTTMQQINYSSRDPKIDFGFTTTGSRVESATQVEVCLAAILENDYDHQLIRACDEETTIVTEKYGYQEDEMCKIMNTCCVKKTTT